MYTSVKASLDAIKRAEKLITDDILSVEHPLRAAQIVESLSPLVEKVMAEGSLYDPGLGALAIIQAQGDPIEAAFLLRAYRSTLPRLGYSIPSRSEDVHVLRRISPAFQDVPGGQVLGRTRDYTLRLLDLSLANGASFPAAAGRDSRSSSENHAPPGDAAQATKAPPEFPVVLDYLRKDGYVEEAPAGSGEDEPFDVTTEPLRFPAKRSARLQIMARGEAGALLSLGYAAMRGYGESHAYVSEVRVGSVDVKIRHPITGNPAAIGRIPVTEAHAVFPGKASLNDRRADLTFGYGLTLGGDERKAISMAIVDENLSQRHHAGGLTQDDEFVLQNIDCVESSGFVEHLKMPHYVAFQADMQRTNRITELMKRVGRNGNHR